MGKIYSMKGFRQNKRTLRLCERLEKKEIDGMHEFAHKWCIIASIFSLSKLTQRRA